jgi:hypothetical protein
MSTRSLIAYQTADQITGVYCHSDGYPEWTGRILHRCFDTDAKVRQLVTRDLSGLARDGTPEYYNEDEALPLAACPLTDLLTVAQEYSAEYIYLWRDNAWHVGKFLGGKLFMGGRWTGSENLQPLAPILEKIRPWPPSGEIQLP